MNVIISSFGILGSEGSGGIRSLFNAGEVGQADISGLWRVLNLEVWLRVFWGNVAAR